MNEARFKVRSVEPVSHDTNRVVLVAEPPASLHYKAGQYLQILLPSGKACSFSIACAPRADGSVELHIRPTPGSRDSEQLAACLRPGAILDVRFGLGDCYVDRVPERPVLMVAASTGISQMKAMLEFVLDAGCPHGIRLYWGTLSADDLYLAPTLQEWESSHPEFRYTPVVSEPARSPRWRGRTGLVADAAVADLPDLSGCEVYLAGGPAMVKASAEVLLRHGLPASRLHSDLWPPAGSH